MILLFVDPSASAEDWIVEDGQALGILLSCYCCLLRRTDSPTTSVSFSSQRDEQIVEFIEHTTEDMYGHFQKLSVSNSLTCKYQTMEGGLADTYE